MVGVIASFFFSVNCKCSVSSPPGTSPNIRLYEELFSYTNIEQYSFASPFSV